LTLFEQTDFGADEVQGEGRLAGWQLDAVLSSGGPVSLWRVSARDGAGALLRRYPHPERDETSQRFVAYVTWRAQMPDHPRLVGVTAADRTGLPHVLLEDPGGETLATRIEHGALEPDMALRIFGDVADALAALARADIRPVDLSPADVLVVEGRGMLLADVGIFGEAFGGRCPDLRHAAPERMATGRRGADGWIGLALARLGPRFAARPTSASLTYSFASVLEAALDGPAPAGRSDADARVPNGFDPVLRRALAHRPRDRHRDPAAVVEELAAAPRHEPPRASAARPVAASRWSRGRQVAAIGGCVLVAAVAGLAVGLASTPDDPPRPVTLASDGLSVEAPAGWARARASDAPFDAGADALVIRAASKAGGGLTVTRSGGALLASLPEAKQQAVRLGGRGAWRYAGVPIGAGTGDVYLVETVAGPIVAACHGQGKGRRASLATCGAIVGTLRSRDGRALPLGGETDARAALAATLTALGGRRARARQALAGAGTRRGQAAAADRLAGAYARTGAAASRAGAVGPPGASARLVARLAAIRRSYAALAAAARAGRAARYRAVSVEVGERERALREDIAVVSRTAAAR
jgi:hypothetical protein